MIDSPADGDLATDLLGLIRGGHLGTLDGLSLAGSDLRGVSLQGSVFSYVNLAGANLQGADFRGAVLDHVNLSAADLSHCDLSGASMRHVQAGSAKFAQAVLARSRLDLCDLAFGDFSGAFLRGARLGSCSLIGGSFVDADLGAAVIDHCVADKADFSRANLRRASGLGSTYAGAKLETAVDFCWNRDMVASILEADIDDDLERARLAGAVKLLNGWCWDAWNRCYRDAPEHLRIWAVDVFGSYPASRCLESLISGAREPESKS